MLVLYPSSPAALLFPMASDYIIFSPLTSGFLAGQFFYMKYLFIFGFHGLIASLDGLRAPLAPQCPASVVLYSQMWKNFDKGMTVGTTFPTKPPMIYLEEGLVIPH